MSEYHEQLAHEAQQVTVSEQEMQAAVEQAKAEILADIGTVENSKGEVMPESINDFSQLHDYVDANTYGGVCDERDHFELGDVIEFQGRVHAWLQAGRP